MCIIPKSLLIPNHLAISMWKEELCFDMKEIFVERIKSVRCQKAQLFLCFWNQLTRSFRSPIKAVQTKFLLCEVGMCQKNVSSVVKGNV